MNISYSYSHLYSAVISNIFKNFPILKKCFKPGLLSGFVFLLVLFGFSKATHANNIQVTNVTITGQNTAQGFWLVQFDLEWENSWRSDNLFTNDGHDVGNWDAVWVFVKNRVAEGEWQHAKLPRSGTTAKLEIDVLNEREAFHTTDNPFVGAFIYRNQNDCSTLSIFGNQLRWNFGVDGGTSTVELDIKMFAIEMMYVTPGPYWLRSGGDEFGGFHTGGSSSTKPFQDTECWDGCIAITNSFLLGAFSSGSSLIC